MQTLRRRLIYVVVVWNILGLSASLSAQEGAKAPGVPALSTIISGGLDTLAGLALPLLIAMAAIGVLTMAVQQVVKDMARLHVGFNTRHFLTWAGKRGSPVAVEQLIRLATGGDRQALFELPDAGLSAQIATASRVALAFPGDFEELLRLVGGPHADEDITLLVTVVKDEQKRAQALVHSGDGPPDAADAALDRRRREQRLQDADQARTRIGHLLDRNIDAFQIVLTSTWERKNKRFAFVLSCVLTVLASALYVAVEDSSRDFSATDVGTVGLSILAAGLLAGFVAPVAKDLVTALQSLRGRA